MVVISLDGTIFDPIYMSYTQRRHLSRLRFLLWSLYPAAFAAVGATAIAYADQGRPSELPAEELWEVKPRLVAPTPSQPQELA